MLPTKVFQLDYQDLGSLVWSHISKIEKHGTFDIVISKLRNGVVPGSILATYWGLPLGVIESYRDSKVTRLFVPEEMNSKSIKVLLVDAICGTGDSLKEVRDFVKNQLPLADIVSYVTLVDEKASYKPEIIGELRSEYIQPPWEWVSFTPQSHLERLEAGYTKATQEKDIFMGFSSEKCKQGIENISGKIINYEWVKVYHKNDNLFSTPSGISFINKEDNLSIGEYRNKYKSVIDDKVNFILSNGITHFFEENQQEAILISQFCPVSHIYLFDGQEINKIYAKKSNFDILRFE